MSPIESRGSPSCLCDEFVEGTVDIEVLGVELC